MDQSEDDAAAAFLQFNALLNLGGALDFDIQDDINDQDSDYGPAALDLIDFGGNLDALNVDADVNNNLPMESQMSRSISFSASIDESVLDVPLRTPAPGELSLSIEQDDIPQTSADVPAVEHPPAPMPIFKIRHGTDPRSNAKRVQIMEDHDTPKRKKEDVVHRMTRRSSSRSDARPATEAPRRRPTRSKALSSPPVVGRRRPTRSKAPHPKPVAARPASKAPHQIHRPASKAPRQVPRPASKAPRQAPRPRSGLMVPRRAPERTFAPSVAIRSQPIDPMAISLQTPAPGNLESVAPDTPFAPFFAHWELLTPANSGDDTTEHVDHLDQTMNCPAFDDPQDSGDDFEWCAESIRRLVKPTKGGQSYYDVQWEGSWIKAQYVAADVHTKKEDQRWKRAKKLKKGKRHAQKSLAAKLEDPRLRSWPSPESTSGWRTKCTTKNSINNLPLLYINLLKILSF
ncbi:hypothetical protein L596_018111 [Steinernema carpocapsae]|uniref:Uncharacterized protein n=1 Tax=Steinernema carpocapsae TaxID=34508 RepID=A0A4U5N3X8_STECR|nr:hypothetical protein L596_018111 [Steinernema carpocapsae]